jgi:hypothetical protein
VAEKERVAADGDAVDEGDAVGLRVEERIGEEDGKGEQVKWIVGMFLVVVLVVVVRSREDWWRRVGCGMVL